MTSVNAAASSLLDNSHTPPNVDLETSSFPTLHIWFNHSTILLPMTPVTRSFPPLETRALLPMPELIDAVGDAFRSRPEAPQRLVLNDDGRDWVIMPGINGASGLICKVVRVRTTESQDTSSTISGTAMAFDADGRLIMALDGAVVTARRTAAVAAYATDLMARQDSSVLALFGTGALAEEHLEAMALVREIKEVRVVGRSNERLRQFCQRMTSRGYPVTASDASAAVDGADIVVTVTTSQTPVFSDACLAVGTHICAMGSYRPERAEIPAQTVARALVVVENREAAWHEAGDLILARAAGLIDGDHVKAELHEREYITDIRSNAPDEVTLFKSVGHVALDIAALSVAVAHLDRD